MAVFVPLQALPAQFQDSTTSVNLSGGTLTFFLAGTSTPTNLFSDNAGTSIGTSITLNSGGYPESGGNVIYLFRDDSIDLKIVLKDATSGTEWTADNNLAPQSIIAPFVTQETIGDAFYPINDEEISVGLTENDLTNNFPVMDARRYGAINDGTGDQTAALQNWIDVAQETIGVIGGHWGAYLAAGEYLCTGQLTITKAIKMFGDGMFQSVISVTQSTPESFIRCTGTGIHMRMDGLTINGTLGENFSDDVLEICFDVSDEAGTTHNIASFEAKDCRFTGFFRLFHAHTEGFYWKFKNCRFDLCHTVFYQFNQNNFSVNQCRFLSFVDLIAVSGNSGPLSFHQSVMENWLGTLVGRGDLGGTVNIVLDWVGNYVENRPSTTVTGTLANYTPFTLGTGSQLATYADGVGFKSVTVLHETGNRYALKGIRRWLQTGDMENLFSSGNQLDWDPQVGGSNTVEIVYNADEVKTAYLNNSVEPLVNAPTNVGIWTTDYLALGEVLFPRFSHVVDFTLTGNATPASAIATPNGLYDDANSRVKTLPSEATPSVLGAEVFKLTVAGSPVAITQFDDGSVGDKITLLAQSAGTTKITHDGTNITLDGGVDFDMAAGDTLELTAFSLNEWTETSRIVIA